MKVVITGSGSGLGLALLNTFKKIGYIVAGYDIKDGKDIRAKETVDQLLVDCKDADVFVNNALDNQIALLESVVDLWKNQQKTIINISSAITYYFTVNDVVPRNYIDQKSTLDRLIKLHQHKLPFIMNVRPDWFDSEMVKDFNQEKMNTGDLANMIVSLYSNRSIRILDIVATGK